MLSAPWAWLFPILRIQRGPQDDALSAVSRARSRSFIDLGEPSAVAAQLRKIATPLSPNAVSAAWADFAASICMPEVRFHALRHSHASMLIDEGVDIVTISKHLGHAKPDITLRVYAHLFRKDYAKAAAAINVALAGSRKT